MYLLTVTPVWFLKPWSVYILRWALRLPLFKQEWFLLCTLGLVHASIGDFMKTERVNSYIYVYLLRLRSPSPLLQYSINIIPCVLAETGKEPNLNCILICNSYPNRIHSVIASISRPLFLPEFPVISRETTTSAVGMIWASRLDVSPTQTPNNFVASCKQGHQISN
jgi:hypothetical protein